MARAAKIEAIGGPEVIRIVDVEVGQPGPGEVRVRHTAIGVNFIDTYHRGGVYPVPLPSGIGMEAVGVVEAVGPDVTAFKIGDRVTTFGPKIGSYATERLVPADSLFLVPDDIDDETVAASLLKGLTTEALVERAARVQAGWTVLVHAAAGGVGLILTQWLKAIGATVIGTAGSAAKAERATAAGADHIILYDEEDVAARVREITGGAGVPVVFDGVGAATWEASLASLARRGLVVSFGNASGVVTGVALGSLTQAGSAFVTRPKLFDYYVEPEERAAGAARLFALIRDGSITVEIGQRFPLEQAADAHRALESRATTGSTILLP
ncbi:quinone oxidoreductase [Sphingomonas naphthae]|uniref:Quinone oxidoreductase n=1 Tax=Sphingomonas naphthae TaxID=1813468 RepID=A0ABY7TJS7_9SPHN|nr:quinone oxidoreductase [Sphingomonas naphthae]WCT73414.1 quinone oxidoreductase [Sphingomonas naphthae]